MFFRLVGANRPATLGDWGHGPKCPVLDLPVPHYKMPEGEDWKEVFRCLGQKKPGQPGYSLVGF